MKTLNFTLIVLWCAIMLFGATSTYLNKRVIRARIRAIDKKTVAVTNRYIMIKFMISKNRG